MNQDDGSGNVRLERTVRPMPGRKKPYTEIGIRRMRCARCGAPARFQWQICSDGNTWRPICIDCDIELNRMVLRWMEHPEAEALGNKYAVSKRGAA